MDSRIVRKLIKTYLQSIPANTKYASNPEYYIKKCFENDWTEQQIEHAILNHDPRELEISAILDLSENLFSTEYNYHPELRITAPQPKAYFNDEGELCYEFEYQFWMYPVKIYKIYHLQKYYYKIFKIKPTYQEMVRDIGGFKHLLKSFTLDQLLFIIDATYDYRNDEDKGSPRSPLEVQDYSIEGLEAYERKVAYDRVVLGIDNTNI